MAKLVGKGHTSLQTLSLPSVPLQPPSSCPHSHSWASGHGCTARVPAVGAQREQRAAVGTGTPVSGLAVPGGAGGSSTSSLGAPTSKCMGSRLGRERLWGGAGPQLLLSRDMPGCSSQGRRGLPLDARSMPTAARLPSLPRALGATPTRVRGLSPRLLWRCLPGVPLSLVSPGPPDRKGPREQPGGPGEFSEVRKSQRTQPGHLGTHTER